MIGIHDTAGGFSDRWITCCAEKRIPFRRIDCLASDVMEQTDGLGAILWHWRHDDCRETLVARQIIAALERKGIAVFPSTATCGHFDDKVAQKYLLEAVGAPLIPSWVFFDRDQAMSWIAAATWPKVWKLRCGAGSTNVRLVRSRAEGERLCRQAFGGGFPAASRYLADVRTRLSKARTWKQIAEKARRAPRTLLRNWSVRRATPQERGYLYFQEFLPGNACDTRITVVGDRAFGFQRGNRPNDFRASGSGTLVYDPDQIDPRCVAIAFRLADRLQAQSLAFDFLFDQRGKPMIAEISYCYTSAAVHACPGHWDRRGNWHAGHIWPEDAILEDLLAAAASRRTAANVAEWLPTSSLWSHEGTLSNR
jgi:hypothetical protein